MVRRVILLSGQIASGKSTLSNGLSERYKMSIFKTSNYLKQTLESEEHASRKVLQEAGDQLDKATDGRWVLDELKRWVSNDKAHEGVVVDSVRIKEQIEPIKRHFWPNVTHIHLTAPKEDLIERFRTRQSEGLDPGSNYDEIKQNQTERQIEELSDLADLVIDTKRSTEKDVLIRATSYIDTSEGAGRGYVDVIVGGQYGSEGKGQIAAYIAKEYDILIRVGGPNAGHSVYERDKKAVYHHLPSGSNLGKNTLLLIGPGAVINPTDLLNEIEERAIEKSRLTIDGSAMIISQKDRENEESIVKKIGSTGQGVGQATSRRITDRGKDVRLAKDVPELNQFIGSTSIILERAYKEGKKILLEGTQGTGLSLFHGDYPYVTSRDTTVSACLSEAGIPPKRVRRVIMVCRSYPIRVESPKGETSGPLNEITWEKVAERSGIPVNELKNNEVTSTTKRKRRVGEFEWYNVHKAALLNGATDIALTFTDYINSENSKAMRFEQLTEETLNFIQEVERVADVTVSLISTGFNGHSIIDKRLW